MRTRAREKRTEDGDRKERLGSVDRAKTLHEEGRKQAGASAPPPRTFVPSSFRSHAPILPPPCPSAPMITLPSSLLDTANSERMLGGSALAGKEDIRDGVDALPHVLCSAGAIEIDPAGNQK